MPVSLSFLNRGTINKQVCRVCHGFAELKSERLCGDCTRIKAQIRLRFSEAVRGTLAIPGEHNVNALAVRAPRATGEHLIFTRSTYSILHEQSDGRSTSILDVMSCG